MSKDIERLYQLTSKQAKLSGLLGRRNTQIEGLLTSDWSRETQFRLDRAIPSRNRTEVGLDSVRRAISAKKTEL